MIPILEITFPSNNIVLYNCILMPHHSNGCFWKQRLCWFSKLSLIKESHGFTYLKFHFNRFASLAVSGIFTLFVSGRDIEVREVSIINPPKIIGTTPLANSVLLYLGCNKQEWEANDILSSCTRSWWSLIYFNNWNKHREWTNEWYFVGLAQYLFWVTVEYQRQHDSSQAKLNISSTDIKTRQYWN